MATELSKLTETTIQIQHGSGAGGFAIGTFYELCGLHEKGRQHLCSHWLLPDSVTDCRPGCIVYGALQKMPRDGVYAMGIYAEGDLDEPRREPDT